MRVIRSTVFNLFFYAWTVGLAVGHVPLLPFVGRDFLIKSLRFWSRNVIRAMHATAGIALEVRGQENLVAGPAIVVSKHQSAFDTLVWHHLLPDPAIVLKKELTFIPIYGTIARKLEMIPVDRGAGSQAVRSMLKGAQRAVARDRHIVIFPQGTRTAPGTPAADVPYHPGAAALYSRLRVPVVPVALNTGLYWPRRTFLRYRGTMVVEFLEPIPPGLDRTGFQAAMEERIETATRRLEAEGRAAVER